MGGWQTVAGPVALVRGERIGTKGRAVCNVLTGAFRPRDSPLWMWVLGG